jgi:hypothetical protein
VHVTIHSSQFTRARPWNAVSVSAESPSSLCALRSALCALRSALCLLPSALHDGCGASLPPRRLQVQVPVPVPVPLVDEISRVTITHAIGPRAAGPQGWRRGQRCFPAAGQAYPGLSRLIQAYRYSIALSQSVLACLDQSSALRTVLPCCCCCCGGRHAFFPIYCLFLHPAFPLPPFLRQCCRSTEGRRKTDTHGGTITITNTAHLPLAAEDLQLTRAGPNSAPPYWTSTLPANRLAADAWSRKGRGGGKAFAAKGARQAHTDSVARAASI